MPRLLLVDDNPSIHRIVVSLLEPTDIETNYAGSANEALALIAEEEPFDIALIDVFLPEVDGWEILSHLRADPKTAAMPIVMMAGVLEDVDSTLVENAPIQAFLRKPVELRDLAEKLQQIISVRNETVTAPQPDTPIPPDLLILEEQDLAEETEEPETEPEPGAKAEIASALENADGAEPETEPEPGVKAEIASARENADGAEPETEPEPGVKAEIASARENADDAELETEPEPGVKAEIASAHENADGAEPETEPEPGVKAEIASARENADDAEPETEPEPGVKAEIASAHENADGAEPQAHSPDMAPAPYGESAQTEEEAITLELEDLDLGELDQLVAGVKTTTEPEEEPIEQLSPDDFQPYAQPALSFEGDALNAPGGSSGLVPIEYVDTLPEDFDLSFLVEEDGTEHGGHGVANEFSVARSQEQSEQQIADGLYEALDRELEPLPVHVASSDADLLDSPSKDASGDTFHIDTPDVPGTGDTTLLLSSPYDEGEETSVGPVPILESSAVQDSFQEQKPPAPTASSIVSELLSDQRFIDAISRAVAEKLGDKS